ncbi:glycosyltransferase family 87 protein [Amycolatopsis viridis]|uniref:Alpha-1,2-mannosyltransferase n=1 Tax=Amycolatopsis viridis TaxID=185678 RepID=A0ABX0SL99_9PSEU|nr:glycosyltransferase family 87 protein [Amycolatopsis viridis]NIH77708.1 alpha-1,2-mannosyltransferase [Amycolatopsis viridis]
MDRLVQRMIHALRELAARRLPWVVLACGLSTAVAGVWAAVSYGGLFVDLSVFQLGARAWWHGQDLYGKLPRASAGNELSYIYPPFSLLPLAPFTVTPLRIAGIGTIVLSIAALAITSYVVTRRVWPAAGRRVTIVISAVSTPLFMQLEPLRETLGFGQVNLWLMALVALDCLVERPRWPRGLLIGLAAAIKVTPAAFLLFFLLRKDFRTIGIAAISGATATALGFLAAPAESVKYWFGGVLTTGSGMAGIPFGTNQAIAAATGRLNLPLGWNWALRAPLLIAVRIAAVVIMSRVGPPLAFVVNAAAMLVISPVSWGAHWVWIAPAALVLASYALRARSTLATVATAGVVVVFAIGPHKLLPMGGANEYHWTWWQHIIGNAYTLVTLAALFATAAHLHRTAHRKPIPVAPLRAEV